MAITLSDVAVPAAGQQYLSLGSVRGVVKTVTFDDSYPTGGEELTAAQVGLNLIYGVVPMGGAVETAGDDTAYLVHPVVAANRSSATLQLFATGASAGAPLAEESNATDASAFSVTVLIIGA